MVVGQGRPAAIARAGAVPYCRPSESTQVCHGGQGLRRTGVGTGLALEEAAVMARSPALRPSTRSSGSWRHRRCCAGKVKSSSPSYLKREVKIERVAINPFSLTLDIGGFVCARQVRIATMPVSSSSTPISNSVADPRRSGAQGRSGLSPRSSAWCLLDRERNNWTDVIERLASGRDEEAGGTHFAISNIQLVDGRVELDDQVQGVLHKVENLSIGLPFVSNLPSKVSIFVEPLPLR